MHRKRLLCWKAYLPRSSWPTQPTTPIICAKPSLPKARSPSSPTTRHGRTNIRSTSISMPSAISWSVASQNSNNSAAAQPASKRQPEITLPSSLSQPSSYGCDKCPHHLRVHEPTSLAAVGEAAVAIECETEMRSQRSDGRVLLRIRIGIGCGNDDDAEPAAILATRRQHRCSQRIALPVAQREEKRHLSLYMGFAADVALDRVGALRPPGLDCLLPLAAKIFLDPMAHLARLMHPFTFRLD